MNETVIDPGILVVENPVFQHDLLITTAEDDELFAYIEQTAVGPLTEEDKQDLLVDHAKGRTIQFHKTGATMIRLNLKKTEGCVDVPVLAHEISHAVFLILRRIGMQHTDASDEAYAYMIDFYMRKALRFFEHGER